MDRILLVEDNKEMQKITTETLKPHYVKVANTLAEAKVMLNEMPFDLVLLDVFLPDGDGIKFYAKLLADDEIHAPVIFLTSAMDLSEKVTAFSLGAEDYITKPYIHAEFRARIDARLKKQRNISAKQDELKVGNLLLSVSFQKAVIHVDGKENRLDLTPHEFKLLILLARNLERVFSRDYLLDKVWGQDVHVVDSTINTHISNLRKKLRKSSYTIRSIYGTGYALMPAHEPSEIKTIYKKPSS